MNKDILIIAHYTDYFDNKGNCRFKYIIDLLNQRDVEVEFITSDFSHIKKVKRDITITNPSCKTTFIPEPTYNKNVCIRRFYSHHVMSRNLNRYLRARKKPDAIYCSVPSLSVAKVAAKYAEDNHIKFIIDIQDLWPEAFKMMLNVPLITNLFLCPMKRQADYIYRAADEIVAVSNTYTKRAARVNKKSDSQNCVFIGTDLDFFDESTEYMFSKPKDEIWLAYIGTLGNSYEIEMVIDALSILKQKGIRNIKFIVMGEGPLKERFENYAKSQEVWTEFTGRLDYKKMAQLLKSCDIAVNPIKGGSAASIVNKVGDYAAAALPVINTQESEEYRALIAEYRAGFNCINGDVHDVSDKLLELVNSQSLRKEMGGNNRRLAEERFDRKKTYLKIVEMLV
ncbi:MAG: glycosyltransferase family 4 protein [Clostridiaceae bacterium]